MDPELVALLADMDIPVTRRHDLGWLRRNLHVLNADHPNFDRVKQLLTQANA